MISFKAIIEALNDEEKEIVRSWPNRTDSATIDKALNDESYGVRDAAVNNPMPLKIS